MIAALVLAAATQNHTFTPTPVEAHRITRIVSHLPGCSGYQEFDCRYIEAHRTLASFRADGGTYYVVVKHRPGHRTIKHAEFYPSL